MFTIPGTFLEVWGVGVLLKGPSGAGKSVLALELIQRGHPFVADDAIWLEKKRDGLFGQCPPQTQDFMHIREFGIINVRKIFGNSAICLNTELKLVIALGLDEEKQPECLLTPHKTVSILDRDIPALTMPAHLTLATLVETAVRDFTLKAQGYNAFDEFNQLQRQFMNLDSTNLA